MKRTVAIFFIGIFLYSTGISAHEGMIALYADPDASSCEAVLPELYVIDLSLFYIRGDGPRIGKAVEFRLLKSNDDFQLAGPIWAEEHGYVMTIGNLESGITIAYHAGTGFWCFEDEAHAFLGTVQVFNISDPDTFTVSVVEHPMEGVLEPWIGIVECEPMYPKHEVIGGTFVFNGSCNSPQDPFGNAMSTQSSTWGAIKGLFNK